VRAGGGEDFDDLEGRFLAHDGGGLAVAAPLAIAAHRAVNQDDRLALSLLDVIDRLPPPFEASGISL
jgi:hypothetical protein